MRISDWSSDVCSSDLVPRPVDGPPGELLVGRLLQQRPAGFDRPSEHGGGDPERALLSESGSIDVERHGPRLRSRSDMATAHTDEPSGREAPGRSEEHTSELQSLMRISYAVFCLKKKNKHTLT